MTYNPSISIDDHMTVEEQIEIIKRARALIHEPTSWAQGAWKCEVKKFDETGTYVPACTPNGTPQYAYCVEGAINQATYDVIGEGRAMHLGAVVFNEETGLLDFKGNEELLGYDPTKLLGIDELAQDMFGFDCAMEYNDHEEESDGEADPQEIHKGILSMLSERLRQLTVKKEMAA